MHDVLILGGGPAGMTAAVYAARKKLDTALVSRDLGGQALWSLGVENYMGYQYITGQELMDKFREQMARFPVEQHLGQEVIRVSAADSGFVAETTHGQQHQARTAIIATGKRSRPLDVPGEKELLGRGVSYCATCDGPLFADRDVAVVGGGNPALAAALDLIRVAHTVYLVHPAPKWQAQPALVEQALASERARSLLGHAVTAILGDEQVAAITVRDADGASREIPVQGVFVETGLIPSSECVADLVELNAAREIVVDCNAQTSRPAVFAAGDVTAVPAKQIVVAAGDGAKAALGARRFLMEQGAG